jgi:hypothetical protein
MEINWKAADILIKMGKKSGQFLILPDVLLKI